jgi:hypothetical protein
MLKINTYQTLFHIPVAWIPAIPAGMTGLLKIGAQKPSLMHDLLTGKVQVNADQPEAVDA